MEALKKKILAEGEVYEGNILKVDCFLNHQIDFPFMKEVGREFHRLYKDAGVNKILTIEASGIAVGSVVALEFACPLVFAKKSKTKNIAGDVYKTQVASFTHGTTYDVMVSKRFLTPEDRVLIVDDFLAVGNALRGLIDLVHQSGATLVGCGTVIEKGYQHGGDQLRAEGKTIDADWTGTLSTGSVELTDVNTKAAAAGTQEAIDAAKKKLEDGSLHVFDTSTFTVNGKKLDSYKADVDTDAKYTPDTEVVKDGYFAESTARSAPYFDVQIDGIKLLDKKQ